MQAGPSARPSSQERRVFPQRCILHQGPHQDGTPPPTIYMANEAVERLSRSTRARSIAAWRSDGWCWKGLDCGRNQLPRVAKREESEEEE